MSAWDAPCELLIERGWGSHPRHLIPADWQFRQGPDATWGKQRGRGYQGARRTYAEIRAARMGQQWTPQPQNSA